jgi:predicted nucleic acid-binding protein
MKGFLDTWVLVPVFYGDHVHHKASLALFIQFDKSTGCCYTADGFIVVYRLNAIRRRLRFARHP